MNYTTEVEFLRAEVEKCHASMHSQIETISLLMKKNIALKEQKRDWVGLTTKEIKCLPNWWPSYEDSMALIELVKDVEAKLKEKNT
jgi:hypothetical protein